MCLLTSTVHITKKFPKKPKTITARNTEIITFSSTEFSLLSTELESNVLSSNSVSFAINDKGTCFIEDVSIFLLLIHSKEKITIFNIISNRFKKKQLSLMEKFILSKLIFFCLQNMNANKIFLPSSFFFVA